MRNVEGEHGSENLSGLIGLAVEAENIRLTKWLEAIRDEAAEIRIVAMATEALKGDGSPKTTPAFTVETAASG